MRHPVTGERGTLRRLWRLWWYSQQARRHALPKPALRRRRVRWTARRAGW